jgi:WD40 repeat protein
MNRLIPSASAGLLVSFASISVTLCLLSSGCSPIDAMSDASNTYLKARTFSPKLSFHDPPAKGYQLWEIEAHDDDALSIAAFVVSPDGKSILTGGSHDSTIRLLDPKTGNQSWYFQIRYSNWVETLAMRPDGEQVAVGSSGGTMRIWDVQKKEFLCQLERPQFGSTYAGCQFSADGQELYCVATRSKGAVQVWDIAEEKCVRHLDFDSDTWVRAASIAEEAPVAALLTRRDGSFTLQLCDLETMRKTQSITLVDEGYEIGDVFPLCLISPDGSRVAVRFKKSGFSATKRKIVVYSSDRGKRLLEKPATQTAMTGRVAFSPDGNHLAMASKEKGGLVRVELVDIASRKAERILEWEHGLGFTGTLGQLDFWPATESPVGSEEGLVLSADCRLFVVSWFKPSEPPGAP